MCVRVLSLCKDDADISNRRCSSPVLQKKTARPSLTTNLPATHTIQVVEKSNVCPCFYITFFISRLVSNGIYVFYEVANLRFPESLDDLPSFISLKNITLLLAVNDVFWRLCKKSDNPVTINNRYKETVDLEGLIGASQDCTRTCAMRYGQ
ncbi:MAG: hypothetical protein EXX96DRAFT_540660 [Benjaminiella poitrasii]|nr:MAG: hypothetical protein EXX96DRAFT_540660 [Benjaminiella poitrasii]